MQHSLTTGLTRLHNSIKGSEHSQRQGNCIPSKSEYVFTRNPQQLPISVHDNKPLKMVWHKCISISVLSRNITWSHWVIFSARPMGQTRDKKYIRFFVIGYIRGWLKCLSRMIDVPFPVDNAVMVVDGLEYAVIPKTEIYFCGHPFRSQLINISL